MDGAAAVTTLFVAFAFQWAIGAVLRLYPMMDGQYAAEGYRAALFSLAALQGAALAWLLPLKERG